MKIVAPSYHLPALWPVGVLCALALCGLVLSVGFTLLFYRVIVLDGRTSRLCRLGSIACENVVFTRYGSLFQIPNSAFGISFYLLVLMAALWPGGTNNFPTRAMLLDFALSGALLSVGIG
ncbi:MAG TPA: vitamin K epoxide reductase family protein, partial [Abditibacteriaceae bacterium]